jgi:hypothetical protein
MRESPTADFKRTTAAAATAAATAAVNAVSLEKLFFFPLSLVRVVGSPLVAR